MKSPLVIGAHSTIGQACHRQLAAKGTSRRPEGDMVYFNLGDEPTLWPTLPTSDVVFLCAAETKLDRCKQDPQQTRLINVERMQALTERLQQQGSFVVFLSTNQVFDGETPFPKADEATSPRNDYGWQKAEFEHWLLQSNHPAAVLRLTKVIPARLPLFDKWQAALEKDEPVEAFGDLRFSPLPLRAVLEAMHFIGTQKRPGIYQLSGTDDISYFEAAQLLAQRLGLDKHLVRESSALASGMPLEFLPPYGTLDRATLPHIAIPAPIDVILGAA